MANEDAKAIIMKLFRKINDYEKEILRETKSKIGIFKPTTYDELLTAVNIWCIDPIKGTEQYGHICLWDTSNISNMKNLFCCMCWTVKCLCGKRNFNKDLNQWNVFNVLDATNMFDNCNIDEYNKPFLCQKSL
jgi:hypothetical protein